MLDITAEQVVFLDESISSNRQGGGLWHTALLGGQLDTLMI